MNPAAGGACGDDVCYISLVDSSTNKYVPAERSVFIFIP